MEGVEEGKEAPEHGSTLTTVPVVVELALDDGDMPSSPPDDDKQPEESPDSSWRDECGALFSLSVPIAASNCLSFLLNVVDLLMVSGPLSRWRLRVVVWAKPPSRDRS